ncbi:MAG: glycosyltransferase family 1 protein [Ruminococcaceae bacterium]|nr:glycosyltransferase family 1 protein [Oscillospiraceae bacterium]
MGKIKVLHIISNFSSGGAERVLLGYMKDLKDDPEVELYALALGKNMGSIFDNEIEKLNLNVKYANISGKFVALKRMRAIRKMVKEIKPDIIHSHLRLVPFATFSTLFCGKLKRIHTIHTVPEVEHAGKLGRVMDICYRHMNVLPICLNRELAKDAEKLYGIPFCEFLYNGIDISKYSGFEGKDGLREKYGIPKDAYVVGHVGRFVPIKNHEFIIDVFNEVVKLKDNAYLILVGEGQEMVNIKEKCKRLGIEDRVVFTGACTNVHEILQIMDGFIFPSKKEGLGIALIEAQAAGCYCVVSDTVPEEAYVSGRLKPLSLNDKPENWAKALVDEEEMSDKRNELNAFSIEGVNDKLRNIYKQRMEE